MINIAIEVFGEQYNSIKYEGNRLQLPSNKAFSNEAFSNEAFSNEAFSSSKGFSSSKDLSIASPSINLADQNRAYIELQDEGNKDNSNIQDKDRNTEGLDKDLFIIRQVPYYIQYLFIIAYGRYP